MQIVPVVPAVPASLGSVTAGAASGALDTVKDGAKAGVAAAYAKVRGLVRKRVAGNPGAELTLAEYDADPESWEAPLTAKLKQVDAGGDADLVAAAKAPGLDKSRPG
jgi:hypothetical protein